MAMLMGRPTVATAVGGLPDLVEDGETGWLVPGQSPQSMAQAVREALDDPAKAQAMAKAGNERARLLCNAEINAARMVETYEHIVAHRQETLAR